MLYSPGIEFIEKTVTPPIETVGDTNGVATIGFSSRGPVNELVRVASVSEFNRVFGRPVESREMAHILATNVLSTGTPVYFMRIASDSAANSTCFVNNGDNKPAKIAVKAMLDSNASTKPYFYAGEANSSSSGETKNVVFAVGSVSVTVPFNKTRVSESSNYYALRVVDLVKKLNNSALGKDYKFEFVNYIDPASKTTEYGMVVVPYSIATSFATTPLTIKDEADSGIASLTVLSSGAALGAELSAAPSNTSGSYTFTIASKNSGSGMDGIKVIKTTVKSAVTSVEDTWNVDIVSGNTVLEQYVKLTPENFVEKLEKSKFIEITDETGTVKTWNDGTYVLGKGQLVDGSYLTDVKTVSGNDGVPETSDEIINLYLEALDSPDFVNCDENTFSILALPEIQDSTVDKAALGVCSARGDAVYLIDTLLADCECKKAGIEDVINYSLDFDNSQGIIYYGWFPQTNPYNTSRNIYCPASVYLAPKMVAIDKTSGPFYAPAGPQNGVLSVSDYIYSPDASDRDNMVGSNNVVNPIVFSNTRGVVVMAQKTTDRTTSPLNRVGVRRMTNEIKRRLRISLQSLLFQPNNDYSRGRARRMVDDILGDLRSKGMVESYSVDVQSGTGTDRNTLNIYLGFRPYGLIENIYVYVSITDAGVEVSEAID